MVLLLPHPRCPAQCLAHSGCLMRTCAEKGHFRSRAELLEGESGVMHRARL